MIAHYDVVAIVAAIVHAGELVAAETKVAGGPVSGLGSRARLVHEPSLDDAVKKAETIVELSRGREPGK